MPQCANCLLELSVHPLTEDGRCPNCGRKQAEAASRSDAPFPAVGPVGPGAAYALFERFWKTVRDVILRPGRFFSENAATIASPGGLSSALAFAVIVQWIASFFNFVWRSTVGVVLQGRVDDLFQIAGDVFQQNSGLIEGIDELRHRVIDFMFGAGAIVLAPFLTLIKLSFAALLVHAGVRFFTKESEDRPHGFGTTLKILSYATAPWILCVIPGFGVLLAWVLAFGAAVVGVREVYRTTTARATLTIAFPEMLVLALLTAFVVVVLFLAFNLMRLVF